MDIVTLKGEPRKPAGSRAAARLRRQGKVPGIVYGHKRDPMPVAVNAHDMELQLSHGAHLVNLDIGGKVQPCLIKEAQYDAIGLHLTHLDLARVDLSDRVKVRVPIELRGTPKGVALGGVLRQELMDLEVECMVSKIPESVRVIVADLELDQVLHVRELQLEEGMTAMNDPETVVATVRVPIVHAEVAPEAAAAAAPGEPEVIAKGKVEEEGAEADKEKAAAPKAAKSE